MTRSNIEVGGLTLLKSNGIYKDTNGYFRAFVCLADN